MPLVVLTADRPPELREVGAGQTIDQVKLYGSAAKWFFEVGTHDATPERMRWMRMLACRAVWTALEGRPGPVHLNFALREPLVPPAELGPDPLQPGRARRAPVAAALDAGRGRRGRRPRAGGRRARRAPARRRRGPRGAGRSTRSRRRASASAGRCSPTR